MTTVTITAGHGGSDPGAVNGNVTEAEIATDMRNMIKLYLERKGVTVRTDGKGSDNQSLTNAIRLISGSKVAIELHCNAFSKPSAGGVEALAQPKDKTLCQKLCKAVSRVMGVSIRGAEGGFKSEGSGQHSRLGYVRNGGIILELFFISNPVELQTYQARKWLVARELADVIAAHVGVKS
jgi:N-acetylmuramoyl-L-alanine amidase